MLHSPFSIALFLHPEEANSFRTRFDSDNFDRRLSILPFIATEPGVYPINKLRNLAIQNSKTNHFWLADLDMWPSGPFLSFASPIENLYANILSLPSQYLDDDHLAIIVPAFEVYSSSCKSFEECSSRVNRQFPQNKRGLLACIRSRRCNTFRPWDQLHDYHFAKWFFASYTPLLTPVSCFKGRTQEPYVVVKKSEFLPSFDERFINYAYNKVEWIEHLRYRGYAFSILTKGFAVDVPHPM